MVVDFGDLITKIYQSLTDWLAGRSFFDHMVLAASGDG